MRRIFIAASTDPLIDDFVASGIDGVTSATSTDIKKYKNGNIGYNGKVYIPVKLEDCKKNINKIIFDKAIAGLDKTKSTQLFKLFLSKNSNAQLTTLVKKITDKIVETPDSLKSLIDGVRGNDTIFIARGKEESQSNANDNDELEQIQANLQEAKQELADKYKNIISEFKNNTTDDEQTKLTKASDDLQTGIGQMIDKYNEQIEIMNNKYKETKNQAFKELKQKTEKLMQQIENSKDQQSEKLIQKLKKLKSKFEKIEIDGKEQKVQTIEKMKGGSLIKLLVSNAYALIKGDKFILKDIKDLNQSNYIKYDDIGFIRVVSNGTKYVVDVNDFDKKIENAFIVDLSSLNEDFVAENFIINQNGEYVIYNRSSKTEKETFDSVKKLKQYIKQNYESDQSDKPQEPEETRFDVQDYATRSDSEKDSYLSGFPDNIQIKQSDFSDFGIDDRVKILKQLWEKGKTIKISRRNRHLSLQQLALNTIFKHLK